LAERCGTVSIQATVDVHAKLLEPGDVVAGKYEIVRVLGEGGMGIVFEARHIRLGQRFAIKMLQPAVVANAEFIGRFEREARAAAQLRGRHVARVVDVAETETGLPFMVMELLIGHDLSNELESRGPLPISEAADHVIAACKAMIEAHAAGIVHRDLKPSNLFLANEPEGRVLKVLDFGISKVRTEGQLTVTSTGIAMGTPLYMSPEQIRSTKNVDERTDIWSLGVILFELLTRTTPFEGTTGAQVGASIVADPTPSLRERRAEVTAELEQIVSRALEKDPAKRHASAGELAAALAPFGTISNSDERVVIALARHPVQEDAAVPGSATARTEIGPPVPVFPIPVAASSSAAVGSTNAAWATRASSTSKAGRLAVVAGVVVLLVGAGVAVKLTWSGAGRVTTAAPPSLGASPTTSIAATTTSASAVSSAAEVATNAPVTLPPPVTPPQGASNTTPSAKASPTQATSSPRPPAPRPSAKPTPVAQDNPVRL
jgi:serine/threonine-protein kinase